MKKAIFTTAALALAALVVFTACDQQPAEESGQQPAQMESATAGLESIIPAGASVQLETPGYEFDTSGSPLWVNGTLFFTNNNLDNPELSWTIKRPAAGDYQVIRKDNGVTTKLLDSGKGTLYCCEMFGHQVSEIDYDGNVVGVVCDSYNGIRIDGPNDMVMDSSGGLYFTDSQFIGDAELMQDTPAVYYVRPDGSVIRVIDDVEFPNGIGLSPDGRTMYLANTRQQHLLAFDVQPDGTVTNRRNFVALQLSQENIDAGSPQSGADGLVVDSAGNIFVATTQGLDIQVYAPDGTHLGNIDVPAATNNCMFGGPDNKTLYISAADGIYSIPVLNAGQ